MTMPFRTAAPACSFALNVADDAAGRLGISEGNHYLVQNHVVQDFESGGAQPLGETRRQPAVSFDHFSQAGPAQRSQGRPNLNAACAAGSFWSKVRRLARVGDLQIRRAYG